MKKSDENILLIHIGTPKTGTTALQSFLDYRANRKNLKQDGWCFSNLHTCLFDDERIKWDGLLHQLRCWNVILSDETIWGNMTQTQFMKCKERYDKIKILVYLRRQDTYIESLWNTKVWLGSTSLGLAEFYLHDGMERGGYGPAARLDYLARLKELEKIFGRENIIVRPYKKDDTILDFQKVLSRLSSNKIGWNKYVHCSRRDEKVEGEAFMARLFFNRTYKKNGGVLPGKLMEGEIRALCGRDRKHYAYFTEEQRKKIIKKYHKENEKIACTYFNGIDMFDIKTENLLPYCDVELSLTGANMKEIYAEIFIKIIAYRKVIFFIKYKMKRYRHYLRLAFSNYLSKFFWWMDVSVRYLE